MVSAAAHHHRSTTKSAHKPFKSRHSTKGAIKTKNKGKVEGDSTGRKTPQQQVMSKLERRNKARQIQANKHRDLLRDQKIFDGRKGAARIVAVISLCEDVESTAAVRCLNRALDIEGEVPADGMMAVSVDRFKQKIQYLIPQRKDFLGVLDACKVADFVIFILSANQEVDAYGESLIRSIESQGISNITTVVQHLETIEPAKRRPDVKKSLLSYITHFFPTETRIYSLDSPQEASNVIRSLCTIHPKGVKWRDSRSYLLAEEVRWDEGNGLAIGGTIRGRGLKADRLVHLPGWGDYQIEKICSYITDEPTPTDAMVIDDETPKPMPQVLEVPSANQDDLAELAPEEEIMRDVDAEEVSVEQPKGVLLDDEHHYEEKISVAYTAPRKLPKGTSDYQAAWIIDSDYEESDMEDDEEEGGDVGMKVEAKGDTARPEDGEEGLAGESTTMYEPTEFGDGPKSEMFLDPSPEDEAKQIEEFRNRQKEREEDLEFPDEVELNPSVLARERFSRYRGLRSLRNSKWQTEADRAHQPENWDRLATIENYKATKNKVLNEALVGGVQPGTRVLIYIRNAPAVVASAFSSSPARPFTVYSLLRHEHKKAVINFSIMPNTDYEEPVRSKDEVIIQCGMRRLIAKPSYSQGGNSKNNVHKFEKFLHPARASIATVVGPIMFGNIPTLIWKRQDDGTLNLIATGSFLSTDNTRVIAKRIVLTGHPFKIHKKLVTVRYMFFNAEDINWFKAIQLYTRRGRSGFIKESLGTHGYFKATFDGKINPQDAVAMSLYKRVFPRETVDFRG